MTEKIKKIFSGQVVELNVETVELPNGVECDLEIIHHPGGVAIIALNDRAELCLLRQYRHAAGGWIWEIPAGKIEPDEAHDRTAQRELIEEAGVDARNWTYLGRTLSSPGVFTEMMHLYLARDLVDAEPGHESIEVIETHWLPINEVKAMIKSGDIIDAKTLVALYYLQLFQEEHPLA